MAEKKESVFPKKGDDLKAGKTIDSRLPLERDLETRDPKVDQDAEVREALREQLEAMRHKIDPDYAPRARAEFLRSVPVTKKYSPANRLDIRKPKGDPNEYRFNSDGVRDRIGMEGWVPITDMEEAKKICPSAHLKVKSDGRIYSGDSYLCKQPKENVEERNAAIFARSEAGARAAEGGALKTPGGGETFADMHGRTSTEDDPIGIRFRGTLSEDNPE